MGSEWSGDLNAFYRKRVVTASLELAAKVCGVEMTLVAANRRRSPIAFARQLAMYFCHVVADMSLRDVAIQFGRDRTTVSHACHAIEDRRECPNFDRQIEHLERRFKQQIKELVELALDAPPLRKIKSFRLVG